MIKPARHTIVVSPIGELDAAILDRILKEIRLVFAYPTETLPLLEDLEFAYDPSRRQYHSTPILERLAAVIAERLKNTHQKVVELLWQGVNSE